MNDPFLRLLAIVGAVIALLVVASLILIPDAKAGSAPHQHERRNSVARAA